MLFQTHILLGIIVFLLLKDFFTGGNQYLFLFLLLLGSILPDIDEPHSKINKWSGFVGKWITFLFQHRTMFHSLFLHTTLFLILRYYWNTYYASALFLGYFAHIMGDMLTPFGVALLYPFSMRKVRGPIRVGGVVEKGIMVVLVILIVWRLL